MSVRIAALPFLAFAFAACVDANQGTSADGSGSGSNGGSTGSKNTNQSTIDPTKICSLLINQCGEIGLSMTECVANYEMTRVSSDCARAAASATCADVPTLENLCFPSCSTTNRTCNDDGTITSCAQGRTYTFTCTGVCKAGGTTYAGKCGTESALGDTSAQPQCWCQ